MMLRRLALLSVVTVGVIITLPHHIDAAFVGPERTLLTIAPPSWVLGAPNNAATLDFDFANGRYWQAPPSYGRDPSSLLTVSRASTEYQPDITGLLHAFPANVAAVTNVGVGVWQAATNEALYSRDLTQTQWVKVNTTAAHTATGADGAVSSASLLTSSAANGTVLQTFTIASEAQNLSVYVRRVTGTGEIDITENNGTTWTALTASNCVQPGTLAASGIVTTGYVRCSVEATLLNPVVGFRIVTNGDAVNIDFVQLENSTFPTPPIATTTTTAVRAADKISAITSLQSGPLIVTVRADFIPGANNTFATGQNILLAGNSGNNFGLRRMATTGKASYFTTVASSFTETAITSAAWGQFSEGISAATTAKASQAGGFNGGSLTTSSISYGANIANPDSVFIGSGATGNAPANGIIRRVSIIPQNVPSILPYAK